LELEDNKNCIKKIFFIALFILLSSNFALATNYTLDADCDGIWHMDGWNNAASGSNSENDECSGGTADLTESSGEIEQRSGTWGPGTLGATTNYVAGKSRYFKEADTEVLYISDGSFDPIKGDPVQFTIAFWVKVISIGEAWPTAESDALVSKWDSTGADDRQYLVRATATANGEFRFQVFLSSNCTGVSLNLNSTTTNYKGDNTTWYHFALVSDDTNATIYVNGQSDGSAGYTPGICDGAADFVIGAQGAYTDLENPANAFIDEVGVFSDDMTSAQINEMYDDGLDGDKGASDTIRTWYVSDGAIGGDDAGKTNCATTPENLTLANSTLAAAGDTVTLCDDGDEFVTETIKPSNSNHGLSSNWVTYVGESGATVTIDASTSGIPIEIISNRQYIKVEDLSVTKPDAAGDNIILISGANNIVIDNVTGTLANDKGIWDLYHILNSDNIEILNSNLTGVPTISQQNELLTIENSTDVLVYNTTLGDVTHSSIVEGTSADVVFKDVTFNNQYHHGLAIRNDPSRVLVDGCTFDHIGWNNANNPFTPSQGSSTTAIRIGDDGNDNPRIVRFSIVDSPDAGPSIYDDGGAGSGNMKFVYLYHNTIYNATRVSASGIWAGLLLAAMYDGGPYTISDLYIRNNIF
jgi:hypothetical protein